jgi:sarcosine oxidase subunit gamma
MAKSALDGALVPGRYGAAIDPCGVRAQLRFGVTIASIGARRGVGDALARKLASTYGIELPAGPAARSANDIALVGTGPGRWLWLDGSAAPTKVAILAETLHDLAAVADQSDSHRLLRLGGARVRELLAKGVDIDLHPKQFAVGSVAATGIAHIPILLWQVSAQPNYEIALPRSYSESFYAWLEDSAAEFGFEVLPPELRPARA